MHVHVLIITFHSDDAGNKGAFWARPARVSLDQETGSQKRINFRYETQNPVYMNAANITFTLSTHGNQKYAFPFPCGFPGFDS